jgi:hypothetical protein
LDTVIVGISSVNYANGYNWTITGNSTIVSGQNTNTIAIHALDSNIQVTVTPVNGFGSGGSSTIHIQVNGPISGSLTGNPSICSGDTAWLSLTANGQGPWSGLLNGNIPFSGNSMPLLIPVSPNVDTYYVLSDLYDSSCTSIPDLLSSSASVTVLPPVTDTVRDTVCAGSFPYAWQDLSINSPGVYSDTVYSTTSCDTIRYLILTLQPGNAPGTPLTITQQLVSNICYARVYRYTASITSGATGYTWTIPNSCGGISGVLVDSGDINSSRIIKLKYFSNSAALLTDSIRVAAFNLCGSGPKRSAKLINVALNPPATPVSITVSVVSINTCGQRRIRYSGPNLPVGNATTAAATGYQWSLTNPIPLQAQLDSGTLDSKTIVLLYASNAAALPGDSIFLRYTSACGNSNKRALKINLAALNPPAAPASITITPLVTSVCGNRKYRFTMPLMPGSTATTAAANGYQWTLTGNLLNFGVIDSGTLTSRIVVIRYTSNNASQVGDSIKAQYSSDCGMSAFRIAKFSVPLLSAPLAPTSITVNALVTNQCGAKLYRYSAPNLPLSSTTRAAATDYEWSFTGSFGSTAIIDSGNMYSQKIKVLFTENAAAAAGDSIRLRYASNCGYSPHKSAKLTPTLTLPPPAPASITITAVSPNNCGARIYRYAAPNLSSGSASVAPATGYEWLLKGNLSLSAVIDSGTENSQVILVKFSSNAAALTGDSVKVRFGSSCGPGAYRASKLSNTALANCTTIVARTSVEKDDFRLSVFPNPNNGSFQVDWSPAKVDRTYIRIFSADGRIIRNHQISPEKSRHSIYGLGSGIYHLQLQQGSRKSSTLLTVF